MNRTVRILYIDDYPLDRELVRDVLEKEHGGFELVEAASRADFETALAQGGFDLILSDFNILGFEGLQVLETVRTKHSHLPVIIVTGTGSEEVAAEAIKRGAADYVIKTPKHIQRLPYTIHAVLEKKRLEAEIAASQRLLQDITDNSYALIYALDSDGRFLLINRGLEAVFGVPRETLIAKTRDAVLPPEIAAAHRANDLRVIAERQPITFEEENNELDGKHTYLSIKIPLLDLHGDVYGIAGISTDITERKQAEEKTRTMNAELEQRVKERTRELREAQEQLVIQEKLAVLGQLAGGVGHELRNPLGVILNAVYYLGLVQPDADDKIRQYYSMIEQEAHNAEKIVTDLLDFARTTSVDREPAAVSELVQRVLERHPVPGSITAALKLPADLPPVYADSRQMEQVLGNLVVNACQAMPKGGKLKISAQRSAFSDGQPAVIIAVKDTGMGITPENMKKLFEPLFTTKIKGIGLGLAVSRKLAEANGGRIEVKSEAGVGSTFTVWMPVHNVTASRS